VTFRSSSLSHNESLRYRPLVTNDHVPLKIRRLHPDASVPARATAGASGLDLYACLPDGDMMLGPDPVRVPCGVAIEFPAGYDAQVRPRSGLSLKGVGVAFGTIDSDYRGEVLVTMWVFGSTKEHVVHHGDRIAQLVVSRLADLPVVEVDELTPTTRGTGGHGSTGS
jgi:dUTP pyrophosphatase